MSLFTARSLAAIALLLFSAACLGNKVPSRIIAYKTQDAPGTGGGQFTTLYNPAINNRGNVVFRAKYLGFGVPGNEGLFIDRNGVLQPYLFKGDDSPIENTLSGTPHPFGEFGDPNINDAGLGGQGHLVFSTFLGTTGDRVLWVQKNDDHLDFDNDGLVAIARSNTAAPGAGGAEFFQIHFGNSGEHYLFNNMGRTAFEATLEHDGQSNRRGIWHYDGSQLKLVALTGEAVPGVSGATFGGAIHPRLDQHNDLVFYAGLKQPEFSPGSIWTSNDGKVPVLTTVDVEDPDTYFGTEITANPPLSLNNSGQLAYSAGFDFLPSNDSGISLRPGGGSLFLSKRDGAYPTSGHRVLLENGQIVFIGTQSLPNMRGIYRAFGAVAPIVRQGQPAPDQPDETVFNIFDNITGNPSGRLAFQARLTGGGTTTLTDRVIYCANIDGSLQLIAREGEVLTLDKAENPEDSVIVTLSSVTLMPIGQEGGNGADGRRRRMSDNGQVVWFGGFRFNSPASVSGRTGELIAVSDCGPPSGNQLVLPTGTIRGHVDSEAPVVTNSGLKVERSKVTLIPQYDFIRAQKGGESDEEYRQYTEQQLRKDIRPLQLDVPDAGRFLYGGLPLVEIDSRGSVRVNRRVYYTLRVTHNESDEIDVAANDGSTRTLNFTTAAVYNLLAQNINPPENDFLVEPLDVINRKETLVADLSALGPNHYQAVEVQVQSFLDGIKSGPSPAQIEAVRRAELAEGMFKQGVWFADSLLGTMLDGLVALMHDLIDDVISNGGAKLKDKRKVFDTLQEELDLSKLQSRGFKGFSGGNAGQEELIRETMKKLLKDNPDLTLSLFAEMIKKGGNAIYALVKQALTKVGMEEGPAVEIADAMKLMFDTAAAAAITQGLAGTAKPIVKALISKVVKDSKDRLIDSPAPYSYTAYTTPTLAASRQKMEAWDTDNYPAFLLDRNEFWRVRNDMGHAAGTLSGAITAYSTALSDAMGDARADIIDLLGPYGRATKKVMDVIKYTSNGVTIAVPFVTIYGAIGGEDSSISISLPRALNLYGRETTFTYELGYLERGVKAAYGTDTLTSSTTLRVAGQSGGPVTGQIAAMRLAEVAVSGAVSTSATELVTVLTDLETTLADDTIMDSIELTSGAGESSLLDTYDRFRVAVSDAIHSQQGIDFAQQTALLAHEELTEADLDLRVAFTDLISELEAHFLDVLLLTYQGPLDPLYIAERQHLLSLLVDFRSDVLALEAMASALAVPLDEDARQTDGQQAVGTPLPAVVVSNLSLTSDSSGEDFISESPENFTLAMKVRNIGASSVDALSADLSIISLEDSITVNEALEQTLGALTANDDAPGGTDESDLNWTFTYDGDPAILQRIVLLVNLLQNGGPPQDFRPFGEAVVLMPDVELFDADLDGMPDAWEADNGLSTTTDDAEGDLDDDGLSNARELDLGTNPQVKDSDGDNLEDGEEVTLGADGFVTDPTDADTDDDETEDDVDGQPLDAGTASAPNPQDRPGEPVVSVGSLSAFLSENSPTASIQVTNAGDGILNWTAVSDNEAIAVTGPVAPTVNGGNGTLLISASPSYAFSTPGKVTTRVRVFDIGGDERDYQEIDVTVGVILPELIFLDGFEE